MAEPTSFFPLFFFPPEISLFWGTLIAITPSGTQEVLLSLVGRKYSIGQSLLTSSPSMILTYLLFSIAPLLTYPLLPPLSLLLAPERCFKTWVLTTYQFFYLSLFLVFRPNERPPSFNFQKAWWDDLLLTVLLQRNTRLFLFPLLLLSSLL